MRKNVLDRILALEAIAGDAPGLIVFRWRTERHPVRMIATDYRREYAQGDSESPESFQQRVLKEANASPATVIVSIQRFNDDGTLACDTRGRA